MTEKQIENKMLRLAKDLICSRYPKGWGGAAVIRTSNNKYYTSVAIETINSASELCIETGAICEVHKFNEVATHCLCVIRENENASFKILTPCGICQERLRFWGDKVLVGATTKGNLIRFIPLQELQPYHWTSAYTTDETEN